MDTDYTPGQYFKNSVCPTIFEAELTTFLALVWKYTNVMTHELPRQAKGTRWFRNLISDPSEFILSMIYVAMHPRVEVTAFEFFVTNRPSNGTLDEKIYFD